MTNIALVQVGTFQLNQNDIRFLPSIKPLWKNRTSTYLKRGLPSRRERKPLLFDIMVAVRIHCIALAVVTVFAATLVRTGCFVWTSSLMGRRSSIYEPMDCRATRIRRMLWPVSVGFSTQFEHRFKLMGPYATGTGSSGRPVNVETHACKEQK